MLMAQLRNEHDMLLALAGELETACAGPKPDALMPLLILLERFNQLLQIHLLREDSVLYPSIISGGSREEADLASRFQEELGLLGSHVSEFDQTWTTTEISRSWPGFQEQIGALVGELRHRIERESEELFPLADRYTPLAA
jgi:iron-sulfur cluster repair protein YtfE (RIC family)